LSKNPSVATVASHLEVKSKANYDENIETPELMTI
jgi:hypothetical protein